MKYLLYWKDTFGRECSSERPESWENLEAVLNAVKASGHYRKGSFRVDFAGDESDKGEP